jgi:hypothetical protein
MRSRGLQRWLAAATALGLLLGGCGGGGDTSEEPGPPPDPLPPAGMSRWAAIEGDANADGTIEGITRFAYDDQGRRIAQRSYAVVDGVAAAEPSSERLWSFDRWSRIVGVEYRTSSRAVVTATYTYGADGRLAAQHAVYDWGAMDTRYTWRDGHIVETASNPSTSAQVRVTRYTYDGDGRVSSARYSLGTYEGESDARYAWRPDGRPSAISVYTGFTASYGFVYDAGGQLVATTYNDDGIYFEEGRLGYDAQGRLLQVEIGPPPEGGDFAPATRVRYRWEAGLCQPLLMPGAPPHAEGAMTGLVSADNFSFGCAP